MPDELTTRIRNLEAERLRPVPPPPYTTAADLDAAALLAELDYDPDNDDVAGGA